MHATDLSPADRFWFNAQVRTATTQFVNEKREEARDQQQSAGPANPQQQKKLHDRQDSRADTRESMQEAGMQAPSPSGQKQRLQELQQQEEQAESLLSGASDGSDPEDGGDL